MIAPLQEILDPIFIEKEINVFLKRDDLIHPIISGNKYRKLKYNLIEAKKEGKETLLTFGGAFSNHIYAVAAAGKEFGFKTIGIIRGEKILPLNPTLLFAVDCGMQCHFISREEYSQKEDTAFIKKLHLQFGDFYLLPEGGSNVLAVKGCVETVSEISINYDFLCCSCATGGTLAGLIAGNEGRKTVLGFSALKGMKTLEEKAEQLVFDFSARKFSNWSIQHDYHFGGYAKVNEELLAFIKAFHIKHNILLDPIYTGKMMYGIYDLTRKDFFNRGSTIVAIHTGGLQGWKGMKLKKPV